MMAPVNRYRDVGKLGEFPDYPGGTGAIPIRGVYRAPRLTAPT